MTKITSPCRRSQVLSTKKLRMALEVVVGPGAEAGGREGGLVVVVTRWSLRCKQVVILLCDLRVCLLFICVSTVPLE